MIVFISDQIKIEVLIENVSLLLKSYPIYFILIVVLTLKIIFINIFSFQRNINVILFFKKFYLEIFNDLFVEIKSNDIFEKLTSYKYYYLCSKK